jgi:hypothetical protein
MFQSIEYTRFIGYDDATKQYEYEFELIDSDFSCVVASGVVVVVGARASENARAALGVVLQEYGKRKLNVAANLVRFFRSYEKEWGYSIELQIELAQKYQPLFTPELKAELDKYIVLL